MLESYFIDNYLTLTILVGFAIIFIGLSEEGRKANVNYLWMAGLIFCGTLVRTVLSNYLDKLPVAYPFVEIAAYLAVFVFFFVKELRDEEETGRGIYFFCGASVVIAAALDTWSGSREMVLVDAVAAFDMLLLFLDQSVAKQQQTRQKLLEKHNELLENQKKLADSKIRLLTKQIHRHFIYNSLVALKSLCRRDPLQAEIFAQNFSDFLRAHLENMTEEQVVPFEKEMEFVRLYLSLERADPKSDFEVIENLVVTDFFLPAFCVEPLVENAVQHGISGAPERGVLKISTRETTDEIIIEVADNGLGMDQKVSAAREREGIGLSNIRARLTNGIEGVGGRLEIDSDTYGTTARVILPQKYKILRGGTTTGETVR